MNNTDKIASLLVSLSKKDRRWFLSRLGDARAEIEAKINKFEQSGYDDRADTMGKAIAGSYGQGDFNHMLDEMVQPEVKAAKVAVRESLDDFENLSLAMEEWLVKTIKTLSVESTALIFKSVGAYGHHYLLKSLPRAKRRAVRNQLDMMSSVSQRKSAAVKNWLNSHYRAEKNSNEERIEIASF